MQIHSPSPVPGTLVVLLILAMALGCTPQEDAPSSRSTSSEESPQAVRKLTSAPDAPSPKQLVAVAPEGSQFEPPVKPEQIPEGAWMCEMGTVHYASMERGDGKCPVCSMRLKHKMGMGVDHQHGESE